jgi:replicative DNA helicase
LSYTPTQSNPAVKPETLRPSQLVEEGAALAQRAWEARERGIVHGPAAPGFPILAEAMCGSIPGGLSVLVAPPGAGKSALAGQLADTSGVPTLIATLEMTPLELLRRSAARMSSVFIKKFRDGSLPVEEWRRLVTQAVRALGHVSYIDGTRSEVQITPPDLAESLRLIRGDSEHALLIVDSVSAWARSPQWCAPENEATSLALRALQGLAATPGVSVLGIGEQNRVARDTEGQVTGAGSRVFEYGCELMLVLKTRGEADDCGNRSIDLILAKNRVGVEGQKIPLRFEGGFQRFVERTKEDLKAEKEAKAASSILDRVVGRGSKGKAAT